LSRSGKARAVSYGDQADLGAADGDAEDVGGSRRYRVKSSFDSSESGSSSPDLNAIWNELMSMKNVVEDEHDRKLRRIESDLRWTMTLVGGQFLTIIGSAIAMLAGE
jgi:hypothetical protein